MSVLKLSVMVLTSKRLFIHPWIGCTPILGKIIIHDTGDCGSTAFVFFDAPILCFNVVLGSGGINKSCICIACALKILSAFWRDGAFFYILFTCFSRFP